MDDTDTKDIAADPLAELQHWTGVIGQLQQRLMEEGTSAAFKAGDEMAQAMAAMPFADPAALASAQAAWWSGGIDLWRRLMLPDAALRARADKDRRFAGEAWRDNPVFDTIRQSYLAIADQLLKNAEEVEGLDPRQKEQLRFATKSFVDAMSPSNFALTNPQVLEKTFETRGQNLVRGLEHMLADIKAGQMRHVAEGAFEIGRNVAATPGKVVKETPLYQLIQYAPTTETVDRVPLIIFPPWINRFYILDLNEKNSFIRWAVGEGITVFVVSWRSADATMLDVTMDDYILKGQVDAIATVRDLLDVEAEHVIGYCVAGTALAMTLAWLAAQGRADEVASATFFTAQVDFEHAGDLRLFVDDAQMQMVEQLGQETGLLDGRYMAATFNLLRGRDLIWNYVVGNYLMGEDYPPFDLLHWNGDVTNLPAKWHRAYLEDFYRDNKLVRPGGLSVAGTPIDLGRIETPAYIEAGREDHIAPPESVWKLTGHLAGPVRFVLAGSGHIAGVVNPPAAGKYQYWTNDAKADSLDAFIAGATETKGSWWPDWRRWIGTRAGGQVPATGSRRPGKGKLAAIEDAPGRYVRTR